MPNPEPSNALVSSLEGALLKTDLRAERLISRGKNALERLFSSDLDLKRIQSERSDTSSNGFEAPVNAEVYEFLKNEKAKGRHLVLDTKESAESICDILTDQNIFDEIIDSNQSLPANYDYIGSTETQQAVWDGATNRFLVTNNNQKPEGFTGYFHSKSGGIKAAHKAIRSYQWLKNLLVFVPIVTSQQLSSTSAVLSTVIMFCCFSAVASFGYIVNDLLDLQSDRAHQTKRNRPFASGALSAKQGALIAVGLLLIPIIGCLFLPPISAFVLLGYLGLTISYSLYLKTKLMIDVVSLGGLFTLRVIGGAAAIDTELSFYLLSFSIFLFSSLGMVKRYAELHNLRSRNELAARGRGYRVEDMTPVGIIGISLGYMSVFVMGLYINSPVITQFYSHPKIIWLLLPLLTYWLGRIWILANRGEVNEDPLIFAVKDRTSLFVAALGATILMAAN